LNGQGYDRKVAFTVPERLPDQNDTATAGERKVFAALREHLPEDYLVYYDIRVGDRYPDFIIIGPDLGVVVLEVKDWRLKSIAGVRPDSVVITNGSGEHVVRSPVPQAREYTFKILGLLKNRPQLWEGERLCCGWGFGAVLPLLGADDVQTPSLIGPSLEEALGPSLILTADDLAADRLLPRLRRLLPRWATHAPRLTDAQVDEIRAALYPEIRVGWARDDAEILEVMNREQEGLAKSLGDSHRLVRGVAGSGKTIVLICRARHLRELHPDWRILVLCFNRVLAEHLASTIGTDDQLEVSTFHAWCARELRRARIPLPPTPDRGAAWHEYWEQVPTLLLDAYTGGTARAGTYQAILVDEGQDFANDWYRAILKALDPATNSLLVALDSSQNIYRRKISWRELGLQVVGHSRVLRVNYRNTRPILDAAYQIVSELDSRSNVAGVQSDDHVAPDKALRDGPSPQVHRHAALAVALRFAEAWIKARLDRGVLPKDILVLGLSRPTIEHLNVWLKDHGIPSCSLLTDHVPGAVRLSTIHSAKGLDAACVLLFAADELDGREDEEARRLLYIGMTRAREELCVSYHRESQLMKELEAILAAVSSRTR
jgi:UvrD-like helicase family protein/nuclease-like protein/AAA domain-containing protein